MGIKLQKNRSKRQELCIDNWKQAGGRATVVAATGFGKSRLAIIAIQRFLKKNHGRKIVIIVPTDVLKKQWDTVLYQYKLVLNVEVKIINSAIKENLSCDFLILDEIHRYNSESFKAIVENTNYQLLLGLTATYERLDGRHKLVMDNYCPVCDTITMNEAIDNGWLSPVKQYVIMIHPSDLVNYNKANQEFLSHFSTFNYDFNTAMKVVTDWKFKHNYVKMIANGKDVDKVQKYISLEAFGFMRTLRTRMNYIYNHPRKIEIAEQIIAARPNKKIITFWKTIKMAEQVPSGYVLHSKQNKKKRHKTMEEFNLLQSGVINSSKALIEGIDCPGLNVAIIGGIDSSKVTRTQMIGRTIRFEPNKEAELFVLCIAGTVEEKWFSNSNSLNYTTVDELELDKLLKGEKFTTGIITKKADDIAFRF